MKYPLYSVRDVKNNFADPFISANDDSAARGFFYAYSNNSNLLNFAPEDFSLYRVGSFDSDTGTLIPELPVFIACAMDFVKKGNAPNEA